MMRLTLAAAALQHPRAGPERASPHAGAGPVAQGLPRLPERVRPGGVRSGGRVLARDLGGAVPAKRRAGR